MRWAFKPLPAISSTFQWSIFPDRFIDDGDFRQIPVDSGDEFWRRTPVCRYAGGGRLQIPHGTVSFMLILVMTGEKAKLRTLNIDDGSTSSNTESKARAGMAKAYHLIFS
jgi:hypothetical protein